MEEASDLALLVELSRPFFKPADEHHLVIHFEIISFFHDLSRPLRKWQSTQNNTGARPAFLSLRLEIWHKPEINLPCVQIIPNHSASLPPADLLRRGKDIRHGYQPDQLTRFICHRHVVDIMRLHAHRAFLERPIDPGGDHRGGHDLPHTHLRRVAIGGDDLIADICSGDDAIGQVVVGDVNHHAVHMAPPHLGQGIRHRAIRIDYQYRAAHPVANFVGHVYLLSGIPITSRPGLYLWIEYIIIRTKSVPFCPLFRETPCQTKPSPPLQFSVSMTQSGDAMIGSSLSRARRSCAPFSASPWNPDNG